MAELDVYCPKCCESRGRRIGDRIVCGLRLRKDAEMDSGAAGGF